MAPPTGRGRNRGLRTLSGGPGTSAGEPLGRPLFLRQSFPTGPLSRGMPQRFVTREKAKVDRIACPWVIRRFVDPLAEFVFVPGDKVLETASLTGAIPFDVPGTELSHYQEADGSERVTFDAVIRKYHLTDPALLDLAEIVRGADATLEHPRPESAGLEALALGFRALSRDDHDNMSRQFPAYDALYAYCQARLKGGSRLEHSVPK